WLKNNYDGTATYNKPFSTLWIDIASYFKNYSHHLIFDILNEPSGTMGDNNGGADPNSAKAIALTRQINNVGYQAIRSTGGPNLSRIIMVEPNGQGNVSQFAAVYPTKATLPGGGKDAYLAVQVHTYDPWSFCGQDGSNANYPGSAQLIKGVNKIAAHADSIGVPVNYGEFGVGRIAKNVSERNTDVVREYYRTLRLAIIQHHFSATVWDDRGWFGLVTKNKDGKYTFVDNIVPAMMAPDTPGSN
ncbi:MAG TPA: cellulase family glycosylhydrolase, partial [Balneolales bacterium]|nr:cellulase family glycosylhydrolase [Balneolales bacterium]